MNKQTDAIFAKMVEKYAKTPPENGEITPEIMEEIKSEMNKSRFVQNLKETCERLENEFTGKEAYEIMIDLHKEEIKKLENEIKKLNQ